MSKSNTDRKDFARDDQERGPSDIQRKRTKGHRRRIHQTLRNIRSAEDLEIEDLDELDLDEE